MAFPAFIAQEITADLGILFEVLNPDIRNEKRILWKWLSPSILSGIDFEKIVKQLSFIRKKKSRIPMKVLITFVIN